MPCSVLLRAFDLLPVRPHLVHVLDLHISKDMRMAANQFVRDMAGDFLEIKRAPLGRELAVKHDLEQQIAEFLRQFMIVTGLDGIEQLINFLDRVPAQRKMVLLAVPRAALRRAQPRHDSDKIINSF